MLQTARNSIADQFVLRPYKSSDLGFILQSWLRSFVLTSSFCRGVPRKLAYMHHDLVAKNILKEASVLIAHVRGSPDQILGFMVFQPYISRTVLIHYAYTKETYRRLGVMKTLLNEARKVTGGDGIVCSHITGMVRDFDFDFVYNPYVLLKGARHLEDNLSADG